MCACFPAYVEQLITGDQAIVNLCGVRKEISLVLVEDIVVGDYIIIHAGYALQKLDQREAERTLAMFAEITTLNNNDIS